MQFSAKGLKHDESGRSHREVNTGHILSVTSKSGAILMTWRVYIQLHHTWEILKVDNFFYIEHKVKWKFKWRFNLIFTFVVLCNQPESETLTVISLETRSWINLKQNWTLFCSKGWIYGTTRELARWPLSLYLNWDFMRLHCCTFNSVF